MAETNDWGWDENVVETDSRAGTPAPGSPSTTPREEKPTQQTSPESTSQSVKRGSPPKSDGSSKAAVPMQTIVSASSVSSMKQMALSVANQSLQMGITSSPSFQELERAIGATLALSLNSNGAGSNGAGGREDGQDAAQDGTKGGLTGSGRGSGVGFNNVTQQKLAQQRLKQQQQYRQQQSQYPASYSPRHHHGSGGHGVSGGGGGGGGGGGHRSSPTQLAASARQELAPFVNEAEVRLWPAWKRCR